MDLPILTDQPQHHADSCLSLSTQLIIILSNLLTHSVQSGAILSIGSGSGLLEAYLHAHLSQIKTSNLQIEGVEVADPSHVLNSYLPEELTHTVAGTWAVCPIAETASGLMFVYPRSVQLVARYLEIAAREESEVKIVFWLGPKCDWVDFQSCFCVDGFGAVEVVEEAGLVGYEVMAILRRK